MKKGFSIPAAPKRKVARRTCLTCGRKTCDRQPEDRDPDDCGDWKPKAGGEIREKLVAAGVRNLKEFGYPGCNDKNILKDYVYARFFMGMLEENKGVRPDVDEAIEELLGECRKATVKK